MEPSERCRYVLDHLFGLLSRVHGRIAAGVVAEAELELSQLLVFFAGEGAFQPALRQLYQIPSQFFRDRHARTPLR